MIQFPWWTKYAVGATAATGVFILAARKALGASVPKDPWSLSPPLKDIYVTQGWWETRHRPTGTGVHLGLDLRAPINTPVYSVADGTVSYMDTVANSAAGLNILIGHPGGLGSRYMHLNGFAPGIVEGAHVKRGQLIGYTGISSYGMDGVTSGAHLHFETTIDKALLPEYEARFGKPSTGFVGMGREVLGRKMSYVPGETLIPGTYRQRTVDRAAQYGIPMHPDAVVEGTTALGTHRSVAPWIAGGLALTALASGGWYYYYTRQ